MNSRERFLQVARGQPVDRVPYLEEELRPEVLARWYGEGLSRHVTEDNYREFFGLDRYEYVYLPLESSSKGTLRSREDFERIERGYRRVTPEFGRPEFWRQRADQYGDRDFPVGVMGWRGFMMPLFAREREWDSLQEVLLCLHDFPDLVKSALDVVADRCIATVQVAQQHIDLDFGVVYEPIASPSGPVISPRMCREFLLPCFRKVVDFFHGSGVDLVIFRSMCNVEPVIPLAVEAGVDGIWVSQVGREIDYVEMRRDYPDLLLIGGLDSTALAEGEDAIRAEVTAKVPMLLAQGRYLPALDDNPRENVPYRNYAFYRKLLREVCEGL